MLTLPATHQPSALGQISSSLVDTLYRRRENRSEYFLYLLIWGVLAKTLDHERSERAI